MAIQVADGDDTAVQQHPTPREPDPPDASTPRSDGDVEPRLPERPAIVEMPAVEEHDEVPAPVRAAAQPSRSEVVPIGAEQREIPEFEEPELVGTAVPTVFLILARTAGAIWAVAIAVTAATARSGVDDTADGEAIIAVGWAGVVVAAAIALAGWWWSDRRTVNVHRLDGRLPSRWRCVSAWAVPLVMSAVLALTIAQLEPSEPFDVRPSIIAVLVCLAMWRPYALVRRIFTTLTRVRHDAQIGTAYVLDIAGFGLLGWQLFTLPHEGPVGLGRLDNLLAVAAAAAIALLVNVGVWVGIARSVGAAQRFRGNSLRTRHEHRILRLRGIDPMDPDVWWSLARGRGVEQQQRPSPPRPDAIAETEITDDADAVPRGADAVIEARVDATIARVRAERGARLRRLPRDVSDAMVASLHRDLVAVLDEMTADPDAHGTALDGPGSADESFAALRQRFAMSPSSTGPTDEIQRTLYQIGMARLDAEFAQLDEETSGTEHLVPPKLLGLDALRLLMVAAFAASALGTLWVLDLAIRVGAGDDFVAVVDRVNTARWAMLTAFGAATAIVPLWLGVATVYLERAQIASIGRAKWLGAAALSTLCVVGLAVLGKEAGGVATLGLLTIPVVAATLASWEMVMLYRAMWLRPAPQLVWTAAMPTVLVVAGLGQMLRPVELNDSLRVLTFFGAIVAVGLCVLVVLVGLSATEFQDELRRSPLLAEPAPSARRRSRAIARR